MWSDTSEYALDQSDNRIHESVISPEWTERWNLYLDEISKEETNWF